MLKTNLSRFVCFLLLLMLLIALFVGGKHPAAGSLFASPWDKAAHAGFYLALYLLLKELLSVSSWIVVPLVMCVGVADEFHQIYLPFRHAGWDDLAADCFGALYGVLFRRAFVVME